MSNEFFHVEPVWEYNHPDVAGLVSPPKEPIAVVYFARKKAAVITVERRRLPARNQFGGQLYWLSQGVSDDIWMWFNGANVVLELTTSGNQAKELTKGDSNYIKVCRDFYDSCRNWREFLEACTKSNIASRGYDWIIFEENLPDFDALKQDFMKVRTGGA